MGIFYYRYEIKGIQSYILATHRLREIAGASALIDDLAGKAKSLAGRGEVLAAAAGGATIRFDSIDDLRRFAEWWPVYVRRSLPGVQLVQAWATSDGGRAIPPELFQRLRTSRNLLDVSLPEAGPLVERATWTGAPAVKRVNDHGSRTLIDAATLGKRKRSDVNDALAERLLPGDRGALVFLSDLNRMGDGPLAVIHADGNDLGQRVKRLSGDSGTYQRFSNALSEATEAAAKRAVARLVERVEARDGRGGTAADEGGKGDAREVPARPIVLGGDDLTMITTARDALPFARDFLEAFEEETGHRSGDLGGDAVTACAGVAYVRNGAPFAQAYALSEELCSAAKKNLRGCPGPSARTPSGILFHRVTAAVIPDRWADIASDTLACDSPASGVGTSAEPGATAGSLSHGPYVLRAHEGLKLPRLADLGALREALRPLPRGPFRQWTGIVAADSKRAADRWRRLKEVATESDAGKQRWAKLEEALTALHANEVAPGFGGLSDGTGAPRSGGAPAAASGAAAILSTPIFDALTLNSVEGKAGDEHADGSTSAADEVAA